MRLTVVCKCVVFLVVASIAATQVTSLSMSRHRRKLLRSLKVGCSCCTASFIKSSEAKALMKLGNPSGDGGVDAPRIGKARNKFMDSAFARGMASGMKEYESQAKPRKVELFNDLLGSLPAENAVVVEVGVGSFPNAPFYVLPSAPKNMDIIGVDPNDSMKQYALDSASVSGVMKSNDVRIFPGVCEALPFENNAVDGVVCSLTLCSVPSQERSLGELFSLTLANKPCRSSFASVRNSHFLFTDCFFSPLASLLTPPFFLSACFALPCSGNLQSAKAWRQGGFLGAPTQRR